MRARSPSTAILKRWDTIRLLGRRRRFLSGAQIDSREDLVHLGTDYGGWTIPTDLLDATSTCYLAGIGEDVTFDLHLIARFGCTVHAFDPVPRSQEYAEQATRCEDRLHVHRYGLWSQDGTIPFFSPEFAGDISHSATNLKKTDVAFNAPVRSVKSVMRELGHERVDLLKLSVEGSEYEILEHVLDESLPVSILCVEYAQPVPLERIEASVGRMREAGYPLVHASIRPWNWKFLYVSRLVERGVLTPAA